MNSNIKLCWNFLSKWILPSKKPIRVVNQQKKILVLSHLFPHPNQPGSGSFVLEQVKSLKKAGLDVRVISGRPYVLASKRKLCCFPLNILKYIQNYNFNNKRWWIIEGVKVRFLPYPIFGPFWTQGWSYKKTLAKNLKKVKRDFAFELIHAHTAYLDGGAAKKLAKRVSCPYIITEHTGPFSVLMANFIIRNATLRALQKSEQIIAVSKAQKKDIVYFLGSKYKHKIQIIPNVVNFNIFTLTRDWRPDPRAPKILFVGYFVPIKNIPLLLEAFQYVLLDKPKAELTLVGGFTDNIQENELIQTIQKLNIERAVKIKGYLAQPEIASLMANECDLLVLCSRSESFGCVVAETLATGKPAVVTRCGGPEDIVIDECMGEICENNDPIALANAILKLVSRLTSIQPKKIRDSAKNRFSVEKITNAYMNLYDEINYKKS